MIRINATPRATDAGASPQNKSDTRATLHFLPRDELYDTEKPYSIQYEPHGDIPQTNVRQDIVSGVPIRDLRPEKDSLTFKQDGVIVKELHSRMQYEDFADPEAVKSTFLAEIRQLLQEVFVTNNVAVLEYLVRRRHASFPLSTGSEFEYAQPVATAHVDFSPDCIQEIIEDRYRDRAQSILQHHFQVVNVWKPLVGPLQDWPLALCRPSSIDPDHDLQLMDRVYPLNIEESIQIHYNKHQDWCYLSNQMPSEVLIFRGGDSSLGMRGGVPHCSFKNTACPPDAPTRESVEVRALILHTDVDLAMERVSESRRHGPKSTYQQQHSNPSKDINGGV